MDKEKLNRIWPEWEILDQLGAGSYGKVYKAVRREHSFEAYAAIKVISVPQSDAELESLRSEGMDEQSTRSYFEGIVDDFVNEIKLMESLKGVSTIVSVEDFRVVERTDSIGWDIFIRMELLKSFNARLIEGEPSEEEIIKLGVDICEALEMCSKNNIIHRDIKPENIFLNKYGTYKLGDFGIAKELSKTSGAMSAKGTYNYIAPEIVQGKKYDQTVDIYSLGIVLYRLLNNNRLPFLDPHKTQITYQERKEATDRRLEGEPIPPPCNADFTLSQIVLTACSYDPALRYKTPTAFKNELLGYITVKKGGNTVINGGAVHSANNVDYDATLAYGKGNGKTPNNNSNGQNPPKVQKYTPPSRPPITITNENKIKEKPVKEKPKKKKGKKALIAILLVLAILIGAAALFWGRIYNTIAIGRANGFADASEYGEAIRVLNDAVEATGGSDAVFALKNDLAPKYVASIVSICESSIANGDYAAATNDVEYALSLLPENSELLKLKGRLSGTSLSDIGIDNFFRATTTDSFTDYRGVSSDDAIVFSSSSGNSFAEFVLDGRYTTFYCDIVFPEDLANETYVFLYGDGSVLNYDVNTVYQKGVLSLGEYDVTGVDKLKIMFASDAGYDDIAIIHSALN